VDLEGHQVFEALKTLFSVEDGGGDAGNDHGSMIMVQGG
jgi:hypothetical protein